ncbi:MAG: trigger factor [Candidatus Sabulitectum sp.]|nr:trigger factor [Candidatus Sabulitectum sp.]
MAYELIKEEGDKRVVQFKMDASDLKKVFRKVKKDISREVNIPGFRPGHVPDSIIEKKFGNIILAEVAENAHKQLTEGLFDKFDWVLSDNDPKFDSVLPVEGKDYVYTVTYHIYQTPEPVDYKEIKLSVPTYDFEKVIEETLDNIRRQFVTFDETDQPSAKDDLVILTYPDPDGKGDSDPRELTAVIGQNDMGPGFDELITGVKAGDVFTMQMKVEKGDDPGLKGPAHTFTVKEVKMHSLPEMDDEFATKAGGFQTMEEFRQKVRDDVTGRFDSEMKSFTERQAIDSMLDSNVFDVPRFMVENLTADYVSRLEGGDSTEETEKAAGEMAERKVREFLILREIAIRESLEITEEEIDRALASGDSRSSYLDRNRNEKALEFVLNSAVIEEKAQEEDSHESDVAPWKWVAVDPSETETSDKGEE